MAYGDLTIIGTPYEFDNTLCDTPRGVYVDATHSLLAWGAAGNDGYAQTMLDDGSGNWSSVGTAPAGTTPNGAHEFDPTRALWEAMAEVDSDHFLVLYSGSASDLFATVLELDGSYVVSEPAGETELIDAVTATWCRLSQLDSTHFLAAWADGTNARAQVLTVNTGTWAITAEGSPVTFSTGSNVGIVALSASRALAVTVVSTSDVRVETLAIDGSWNVTESGSTVNLYVGGAGHGLSSASICPVDSTHAFVAWNESTVSGPHSYVQVVVVDGSNNVSAVGSPVNGNGAFFSTAMNTVRFASDLYVVAWIGQGASTPDMFSFTMDGSYALTQVDSVTTAALTTGQPNHMWVTTGDRFAYAYTGPGTDGFIVSIQVDTTAPPAATWVPKIITS